MDLEANRQRFITLFNTYITAGHADKLLSFLEKSDFFTAPASTRFHGSYEGGLCEHSLQVYDCLKDYLSRDRVKNVYELNVSDETIAKVALLHDVCKINCYKVSTRNKKDTHGNWIQVPYYEFDDPMPYGHGEKSVYIIRSFIPLSREEAFAIRYHMGFSSHEPANQVGSAFTMYPLAFALSTADMEATYFIDQIKRNEDK